MLNSIKDFVVAGVQNVLSQEVVSRAISRAQDWIEKRRYGKPVSREYIEDRRRDVNYRLSRDIKGTLESHGRQLTVIRQRYELSDADLITDRIRSSSVVPEQLRNQITNLHSKIRERIHEYANEIEELNQLPLRQSMDNLSLEHLTRANAILDVDKSVQVSLTALELTVNEAYKFNEELIARTNSEINPQNQFNYLVMNAVLIYEINSFLIEYFEQFQRDGISGKDTLSRLYTETLSRVERARKDVADARNLAKQVRGDQQSQADMIQDDHEQLLNKIIKEWETYRSEIVEAEKTVRNTVANELNGLRLNRANAKARISVLDAAAVSKVAQDNIQSLERIQTISARFKLAHLTSARINRLIGREDSYGDLNDQAGS